MRAHLGECQFVRAEPLREFAAVSLGEVVESIDQVCCYRQSGVLPDDRAQFVLFVKTEAVVDRPTARPVVDDVTGLAIGVVGDDVKGGERREPVVQLRTLAQREVVLLEILLDPPLQRPAAEGGVVTRDGRGHEVGVEHSVEFVRGDLAFPQAVGKVPERSLSGLGLVTGLTRHAVERHAHEQGLVGRSSYSSLDLDIAF